MKDRKKLLIIVLAVALLAVLTIGITYAAFTFSKAGNNENKLTTGTVTMIYTEGTNKISITNAMPITDEEGIILTNEDQVFDFTVAITITGSQSISYEVTAEKDS
jgi:flagellar basal body-associated protein FliL